MKKTLKQIIICPDCKDDNLIISKKNIKCSSCKNSYPIIDGIPLLIKKSAQERILKMWEQKVGIANYDLCSTNRVKELMSKYSNYGLNLDAGCGLGLYTKYFKKPVISVDILPYYIKKAKQKNQNPLNLFIIADVNNLPFKDKSFTFCFCSSVLEHLRVKESCNVLRKLTDLSYKYIMVDVPNDGNIGIKFARWIFTTIFKKKDPSEIVELNHARTFSVTDLKKAGFKVYGCLGGISYKKIKNPQLIKATEYCMRLYPPLAGTIVGIKNNELEKTNKNKYKLN